MTTHTIEDALAEVLDGLTQGAEPQQLLAKYPGMRAELLDLLKAAGWLRSTAAATSVSPNLKRRVRQHLHYQISLTKSSVTNPRPGRLLGQYSNRQPRRLSMSWIAIFTLIASALTGGAAAYAADGASPGETLHALDLALEQAQLSLAGDDLQQQVNLRLAFAEERLTESQERAAAGDEANAAAALGLYGDTISAIAQTIGSAEGEDQQALAALLEAAHSIHIDILTTLLDQVPEQARGAVQGAIDASSILGSIFQDGLPGGPPDNAGQPDDASPPNDAGPPDGAGPPNDAGPPDGAGPPDSAGPPNDVGPPDGAGPPSGAPGP